MNRSIDKSTATAQTRAKKKQKVGLSCNERKVLKYCRRHLSDEEVNKVFFQILCKAGMFCEGDENEEDFELTKDDFPDECIVHGYAQTKSTGYGQVRFRAARKSKDVKDNKYYCHTIACIWGNNYVRPNLTDEGSHLCGNGSCINPKHLCFENGEQNKSRYCCKLHHKTINYRCPHIPGCIFSDLSYA